MNSRTKRVQMLFKIEHIRRHLIDVGLIDQRGEVISPENVTNRSRSHHSQPAVSTKPTVNNRQDSKQQSTHHRRRLQSASTSPSKRKNKSQSSTRPSSPVDRHRLVRPKKVPPKDRCLVTMIYYGSSATTNPTRDRRSDEIVVMQQHCGGPSIPVYRGTRKSNETFQFQSRRHCEYPFALVFYVNGLIDHRLSICCEYRCKSNVRLSGKGGRFGIVHVQKGKACPRCRDEKKSTLSKAKNMLGQPSISSHRSLSPEVYSPNMAEREQNLCTLVSSAES